MNAFETLGLRWDADQAQVHAAYRSRVKGCHPDQFQDQAQADQAQEQLIRLNLAYEVCGFRRRRGRRERPAPAGSRR